MHENNEEIKTAVPTEVEIKNDIEKAVEEAEVVDEKTSDTSNENSKKEPDVIVHYRNAMKNKLRHQRKVLAKRRAADKNAKKMRKLNRKH